MPAPPELAEGGGAVGLVEIAREVEAEQRGHADRHVGIGAEIAVDLRRIGVEGQPGIGRAHRRGVAIDRVHQLGGQGIGQQQLLGQAAGDQQPGHDEGDPPPIRPLRHQRQEMRGAHDRPRRQVREEADIDQHVQRAALGHRVLAVDIEDVAQRLEHEERDPHRQHHPQQGGRLQAEDGQQVAGLGQEEVGVLEVAQHQQRHRHRARHRDAARLGRHGAKDAAHPPGPQSKADQQQAEPGVPGGVEHQAGGQQQRPVRPGGGSRRVPHQQPMRREDHQEEQREGAGGEQHSAFWPVRRCGERR